MSLPEKTSEISEWTTTQELTRTRLVKSLDVDDVAVLVTNKLKSQLTAFISGDIVPDNNFHRLCGRIVLAVLLTKQGIFYEGINTEMSIVTGSICAERAAIVHARSRNPNLKLIDFLAIACVTIPLTSESGKDRNPLWPCGVCMEWVMKIQAKNPQFTMFAYSNVNMEEVIERRTASLLSPSLSLSNRLTNDFTNRPIKQNLRASYRKILEVFSDGFDHSKIEVKRKLPWVRKWWISDLLIRGCLIEKAHGIFALTNEGNNLLNPSLPSSPNNMMSNSS